MKLKHLIQGYNFNKIPVKIEKEITDKEEKAGVLKFNNDINASYLLDDEDIVIAMNLFSNCVIGTDKTLDNQLKHTTKTLEIVQKTIELLGNTKQDEANSILNQLELFSGKIKNKSIRFTNHIYKVDIANGILIFSIIEVEKTQFDIKNKKKRNKKII